MRRRAALPPLLHLLLLLIFFLVACVPSASSGGRKYKQHRIREHDYGSKSDKQSKWPPRKKPAQSKSSKAEGKGPATPIASATEPPPPSTQQTQSPTDNVIPAGGRLISLSENAKRFALPSDIHSPTTIKLDLQDNNNSSHYEFILPTTNKQGQLLTLTRVDRNVATLNERRRLNGQKDVTPTHIPISRSYDGGNWQRTPGRYISETKIVCGYAVTDGKYNTAGEYLCQLSVPRLELGQVGYYLTYFDAGVVSPESRAARFLHRITWGPKLSEIEELGKQVKEKGDLALALYLKEQTEMEPTSHRQYFRRRLNARSVESYQYGITGPKACEMNARFRRFAFTHKDVELSTGAYGHVAGNTGLPMTKMSVESINLAGATHYQLKFGKHIRTILKNPLQYSDEGGQLVTLPDGKYTICSVEEVVGTRIGGVEYDHQFQVLVGDVCESSYTNRGGDDDGEGDGARDDEQIKSDGKLFRFYDREQCMSKCNDASMVKLIMGGNPPIDIPDAFDKSKISWIGSLPESHIVNINTEQTYDSVWLLTKDLDSCLDENGNEILDPAGMANTDYSSTGRGKYNPDPPVFVELESGKWAIQDLRTILRDNSLENPLMTGAGDDVKRASRAAEGDDDHLVVRCSNVERNIFNEHHCKVSYEPNVCTSKPLPDSKSGNSVFINNPGGNNANGESFDRTNKYFPPWAGPSGGGVIVCGSPNEVEPDPYEEDHYDLTNRKVQSIRVQYDGQKRDVWINVNLHAKDQLCQKLAWHLSKTFATSTNDNADAIGTEQNIQTYDTFVTSCMGTFKELVMKESNDPELSLQLTFQGNMAAAREWHRRNAKAFPDENYARELMQLHNLGQFVLDDDGTVALNEDGKLIGNYEQTQIFESAKVWTGQTGASRTGNAEELDWNIYSYKDSLTIRRTTDKDWFPKLDLTGGYVGDTFPLCSDLPKKHWLKKGAQFTHLAGSSEPVYHTDDPIWVGDPEIYRLTLDSESPLFKKLCSPKNPHSLPQTTLTSGNGIAKFNPQRGVPTCQGSNVKCDSVNLLKGRIAESNRPNTIDGCVDGSLAGTVSPEESVQRIVVKSTKKGRSLRGGEPATIHATVVSKSFYDRVDFYYSASVITPNWIYITTVAPKKGEFEVNLPRPNFWQISFNLPKCDDVNGCKVAVRVVLRSGRDALDETIAGSSKPAQPCGLDDYDDNDDLAFDILPSKRPQDLCDFQINVELDESLSCHKNECLLDTVSVVEVLPGVYYEYIPRACVHLQVYPHPLTVFSGYRIDATMCANRKIPSAMSTCCGRYENRNPEDESRNDWADVLCEFRKELVTFDGNEERCALWGRKACEPLRVGPFSQWTGHCLHHKCCEDVKADKRRLEDNNYQWTTAECSIQIKVNPEGLVAIVHKPSYPHPTFGTNSPPEVQSHVHPEKTISYFNVHWNNGGTEEAGKVNFPNVPENGCDGGEVMGEHCLCDTDLVETIVFNYVPKKDEALAKLKVGFFDLDIFDVGTFVGVNVTNDKDVVSVFKKNDAGEDYTTETVFRVDNGGSYVFLKNVQSTVRACDGRTFSFRNPPSFFDPVSPHLYSAYQEMKAYVDHVDSNDNTPRFVCTTLLKQFGFSNPSPDHVLNCIMAYKEGMYTWRDSKREQSVSFGRGKRGDLRAIMGAIHLHSDSLSPTTDLDPGAGGVREPQDLLMNLMRSLEFQTTQHHKRIDGLLSTWTLEALGQSAYGTSNQFGYFQHDYSPPGPHTEAALVAPESVLFSMGYVTNAQNGFYALIVHGLSECDGGFGFPWKRGIVSQCGDTDGSTDHTAGLLSFVPKGDASSGSNVVDQLVQLLTGSGRLHEINRELIERAYEEKYLSDGSEEALKLAQMLLISTPEARTRNIAALTGEKRLPNILSQVHDDEEYSAVVVVFLDGGLDCLNMIVPDPLDCPNLYEEYKEERGESNHLTPEELIKIDASTSQQPCASFGVNMHLAKVADMYKKGEAAFIAGIGYLPKFVNKTNYQKEPLAQVFAHPTMRDEAARVNAKDGTGVLGRIADMLSKTHSTSKIAVDKDNLFLLGDSAFGQTVNVMPSGSLNKFFRINSTESENIESLIEQVNSESSETSSLHAELWSQSLIDAKYNTKRYIEMLSDIGDSPNIPKSILGRRLNTVSKMIKVRSERGVTKDFFVVEDPSYDHHFEGKTKLHPKFDALDAALNGFRQDMKAIGTWARTTVIVVTEFGRSISPNAGGGTDHAWLGHALLLGGGIKGGTIHGKHPSSYRSDNAYNIGRGLMIPHVPHEALWSAVAQHVGIKDDEMEHVLPNMASFDCDLLSEADLYKKGTRTIRGC